MPTDWDLVRVQYELFGEDPTVIAEENDVSLSMVEYAIEDGGWERLPMSSVSSDIKDLTSLEEVTDDLLDAIKQKMSLHQVVKLSAFNPKYTALEAVILSKATEIAKSLNPDQPGAAQQLKTLTEVISSLQSKNQVALPSAQEDGTGSRLVVQIMNKVSPVEQRSQVTEIEVPEVRRISAPS